MLIFWLFWLNSVSTSFKISVFFLQSLHAFYSFCITYRLPVLFLAFYRQQHITIQETRYMFVCSKTHSQNFMIQYKPKYVQTNTVSSSQVDTGAGCKNCVSGIADEMFDIWPTFNQNCSYQMSLTGQTKLKKNPKTIPASTKMSKSSSGDWGT